MPQLHVRGEARGGPLGGRGWGEVGRGEERPLPPPPARGGADRRACLLPPNFLGGTGGRPSRRGRGRSRGVPFPRAPGHAALEGPVRRRGGSKPLAAGGKGAGGPAAPPRGEPAAAAAAGGGVLGRGAACRRAGAVVVVLSEVSAISAGRFPS